MKLLPIALAERESGIAKETLRVWERRYGFPVPQRDANGDRRYDARQVEKLRLIKQLLDRGHRPAGLVTMRPAELTALLQGQFADDAGAESALATQVITCLRTSRHEELLACLTRALASQALVEFVTRELAPLNVAVGEAWAQGRISVAQEHLYTELVQKFLRGSSPGLRAGHGRPRVLLATLPGEQHALGLLMVECVIAAAGGLPISLGTEVPLAEIADEARAQRCDSVGVSFSRARTASFVTQGVKALRGRVAPGQELWIGGEGAAWLRQPPRGVLHLPDLSALQQRLGKWTG